VPDENSKDYIIYAVTLLFSQKCKPFVTSVTVNIELGWAE